MSTTAPTETKWFPVKFEGWRSNGDLDPLIRDAAHLAEICKGDTAEITEAARIAAIRLNTYDGWPYPGPVPQERIDQTLAAWFESRRVPHWSTRKEILPGARTIAQVVAKLGGTDSRAGCESSSDLARATELVGSYNEFDAHKFNRQLAGFALRQYYNPGNPNNGGDLFKYWIGWECSHVVYVRLITPSQLTCRALNHAGTEWRNYTQTDFTARCQAFAANTKANESDLSDQSEHGITWRFWWD